MDPKKADFIAQPTLAIVGISKTRGFANDAFRELRQRGYRVFPVSRTADRLGEDVCYKRLDDLPEPVGGVVACVPSAETEGVVADCARLGINRVWMQYGAASPEAIRTAEEKGLAVVHGACILMHAKPTGFHRFHATVWKLIGRA
jgi:predicted CoA-binding protein